MSKAKDKDDGDAPKKSKKKLIIIIVALVIAVAGGGAGGYMMFAPAGPKAAPKPGIVVPLEAITINLAEGHFLKLRIALQATSAVAEALDGSKALDIAINLFSNRSVAELSSNEMRNRMKKELLDKLEKAYEEEVMDVYLTEFVMQ
jgi:flagellar protein FliL